MQKKCSKCKLSKPISRFLLRRRKTKGKKYIHSWCKDCCNIQNRRWYHGNLVYVRERAKIWGRKSRRKMRLEVLSKYSGGIPTCACCGEKEFLFLTIDHMNNDGAAHRRQIGEGAAIYLWLRKNRFPSGFQVLCWNCHMAKTHWGLCPHRGVVTDEGEFSLKSPELSVAVRKAMNQNRFNLTPFGV